MRRAGESGFSLIEILVALFLMQLALLSLAPMFIYATRATAAAGDMGSVGAVAAQRMELLRQIEFANLTAGGSLTANTTGFFDASDPNFRVRWRVVDDASPATLKTVEVWVEAQREVQGLQKTTTLATVVAVE